MRIFSASRLRSLELLLVFGFYSVAAAGQEVDACLDSTCRDVPLRENLTAIGVHVDYLRGIFGGFEQGAGIAGGGRLTTAKAIPHLELRASALASTRSGRRLDLESVFTFGTRNHANAWFSYMERQHNFFGIGPSTPKTGSNFATDQRSYQVSLYRDLAAHFQGGVFTQVKNSHSGPGNSTKTSPITATFSPTPAPTAAQWAPGLLSTTQVLSYGGFLAFDTRDKSAGLTRGVDLYARVASNDGMKGHAAYADYGWLEGEVDARGYIPLGSPRTSLALRSRGQLKKTRGGSQIPFYDLSYLGGRDFVRGYESYRFRGNNLLMGSAELRQTVYRKSDQRGVDVFAFGDSGQVWGDSRSSTDPAILANQHFSSSNWRSGGGGGFQYRHSRSFAGRVEAGRSNEGTRIYASMSRGF